MIGQTLGHYRVTEKLGAGGMGEVYRARDERLERDVALKILPQGALGDEEARRRFRKEALALSRLNHANIATVYDFDRAGEIDFLAMELVEGETLRERIGRGPLSEKEIASFGEQISEALTEAHERGIIHRDLKPQNIVVTPKGRAKVLDFGLAKLLRPESEMSTTDQLSGRAAVAGTLPYMSPEQLRGKPADGRSDIYAAGAVLYEMATGQRAFREEVATALVDDILHKPPPPPGRLRHDLSPRLEEIILKCLEKEPENRYQSAKELAVDLRRLAMPSSVTTTPATRAPSAWRKTAIPAIFGAAGLLMLAAVLVGFNVGGYRERLLGRASPGSIESLAVLPLENLSRDPEQDYFADGITEALITDLAQISALRVISRTSVMQYKGVRKPLPEIAQELHVDALVEGSVQRSGDHVRITAQLIQEPADKHLWARSYERDLRDVLALQDDVASAIATEVRVKLTRGEQTRLANSRTVNPQALEVYLKGLYYFNDGRDYLSTRRGPESLRKGVEYFEQATKIDPNYALAYSGLARAYHWLAWVAGPELYAKSTAAARKALEIDDTIAEAHGALGYVMSTYDWNWSGAEREFKRAIELNPGYGEAHHAYALYLNTVGRLDEAIIEINRAIELDPLTLPQKGNAGEIYSDARQYDRAIQQYRNLIELSPNQPVAHEGLGTVYVLKGMYTEGLEEFQRSLELSGGDPRRKYAVGWAYAVAGKRTEATKILEELRKPSRQMPFQPVPMARIYVALGDNQQALAWLEKAYQERSDGLRFVKTAAEFDSLRPDSRFQDLLRRMGLPP
jgi:TolB-like protein/tetratricopeptide (TPR) repeat protein/predicted Ser/Thr protein kinase